MEHLRHIAQRKSLHTYQSYCIVIYLFKLQSFSQPELEQIESQLAPWKNLSQLIIDDIKWFNEQSQVYFSSENFAAQDRSYEDSVLSGKFSYNKRVFQMLQALDLVLEAYSQQSRFFSIEQFTGLWDHLINSSTLDPQQFISWILKSLNQHENREVLKQKCYLHPDLIQQIFLRVFCDPVHLNLENINPQLYYLFTRLFICVNSEAGKIKKNDQKLPVIQVLDWDILGYESLWQIFTLRTAKQIAEMALQFILRLHQDSLLSQPVLATYSPLIARCLTMLEHAYQKKDYGVISKSVLLLEHLLQIYEGRYKFLQGMNCDLDVCC